MGAELGDRNYARDGIMFITQSKFYSPAFNAAIFDGPIRIYFAQYQEAQALKLYFNIQERFSRLRQQARGLFKERGRNLFVMLYPTQDIFADSFPASMAAPLKEGWMAKEVLGLDFVIGVSGPLTDDMLEGVCLEMDSIINCDWPLFSQPDDQLEAASSLDEQSGAQESEHRPSLPLEA